MRRGKSLLAKKAHFGENELNTDDPVDDRSLWMVEIMINGLISDNSQ